MFDPSAPAGTAGLVCQLCRGFYDLGWVTGTGGGLSIRDADGIHIAPSGVQKEALRPADLFLLDAGSLETPKIVRAPSQGSLRISECTPLFLAAYRLRNAGAVLHSHSLWAVLAARLAARRGATEFVCRGWEMQKGLRGHGSLGEVRVPIIPNTAHESELTASLEAAMNAYPDVDAVLVAGHGVYVWGATWQSAKTSAECLDWLFRAEVESERLGFASETRP